jgi:hypothetical protein
MPPSTSTSFTSIHYPPTLPLSLCSFSLHPSSRVGINTTIGRVKRLPQQPTGPITRRIYGLTAYSCWRNHPWTFGAQSWACISIRRCSRTESNARSTSRSSLLARTRARTQPLAWSDSCHSILTPCDTLLCGQSRCLGQGENTDRPVRCTTQRRSNAHPSAAR